MTLAPSRVGSTLGLMRAYKAETVGHQDLATKPLNTRINEEGLDIRDTSVPAYAKIS